MLDLNGYTGAAGGSLKPSIEAVISHSIDVLDHELYGINQKVHDNPELRYQEFQAHANIIALLQSQGLPCTPHAFGLETAFVAEYGSGGRVVTFCCEYDALPGIGHGCGHNLIAVSAIASFFGLIGVLKTSGLPGRVRLLGTPAEEGGGGKLKLIEAGAFNDVDAAIMSHPFPYPEDMMDFDGVAYGNCLAVNIFHAYFQGKAAHGAVSPWIGRNASDAAALTYNAVAMLRQQTKPTDIMGLIIQEGGKSSNIISESTVLQGDVRGKTLKQCMDLTERMYKCFEGAAIATDCTLEIKPLTDTLADLRPNSTVCSIFTEAMAKDGKRFYCDLDHVHNGSYGTDMGNVSYVCPSFHGKFHVKAPAGVPLHSSQFADAAGTREAHDTAISVAKGMAVTGYRILEDDSLAKQMKEDFEKDRLRR